MKLGTDDDYLHEYTVRQQKNTWNSSSVETPAFLFVCLFCVLAPLTLQITHTSVLHLSALAWWQKETHTLHTAVIWSVWFHLMFSSSGSNGAFPRFGRMPSSQPTLKQQHCHCIPYSYTMLLPPIVQNKSIVVVRLTHIQNNSFQLIHFFWRHIQLK